MKITAKVVADSCAFAGNAGRITTMQLEYPRFIHSEMLTHRVFSRNASSSRAIPVDKLIALALDDPAFFVNIGSNKPGMQAGEEVDEDTRKKFAIEWAELSHVVAQYARRWSRDYGIHKQVVNRVMEPWHHIKVVVTATDWSNFFELRDHPAAQPEMRALAVVMKEALDASEPRRLMYGNWHLPYADEERSTYSLERLIKASAARCARVSYMNHDGTHPDIEKDIALHDMLVAGVPIHASPAEHQAMLAPWWEGWMYSNLEKPWCQYRKIIEEEREDSRHYLHSVIMRGLSA